MEITLNELKNNPGKYIEAANIEPVYIVINGKQVAKITGTGGASMAEVEKFFGILSPDTDLNAARKERLNV